MTTDTHTDKNMTLKSHSYGSQNTRESYITLLGRSDL
jgi:hypothetical protein